jgi:DNA-binding NtrC family response regulator
MKVLITLADVEAAVRLNARLEAEAFETVMVSPLDDIRSEIKRSKPDLIVLTGAIADPSSIQVVKDQLWEGVAVLGLADVSDPELMERMRAIGFVDVYAKPISPEELFAAVRGILDRQRLTKVTGLIGQSDGIRQVLVKIEQMAPVSSTVLVEGESGTGKELVARALHRLSPRRNKPFIAVNVGALPETLIESELFGHEKGAFTGAAERRLGRFELAHGGTLFLDEIGEVPPSTQVKLLRALEEGEVMRVGGTSPINVDVRVVAASNQPLRLLVSEGAFRADLFYRLNVLSVYLPPLRERPDDIPLLVRRFVREFAAAHDRPFRGISGEAMQLLTSYQWPGNVRELRNLIESMVVLAPGREIEASDIPREIRDGGSSRFLPVPLGPVLRGSVGAGGRELEFIVRSLVELKLQVEELRSRVQAGVMTKVQPALSDGLETSRFGKHSDGETPGNGLGVSTVGLSSAGVSSGNSSASVSSRFAESVGIEPPGQPAGPRIVTIAPGMTMAEIERAAIQAALAETKGNRRKAAEMLGIGERTMYRKLRDYNIPVP